MAQTHNTKKSGRRDVLLAEADALLATAMGSSKTKGKGVQSDDEEADVLDTFSTATLSAPVTKPKKPITSAKNRFGKLSLMKAFKANPGAMKKARKKAKANKSSEIEDSNQALYAGWLYRSAFCRLRPTASLWSEMTISRTEICYFIPMHLHCSCLLWAPILR